MTVDDKLIAAPINVEGVVLYYRTDLFDKYGVTPPKTLDELTTAAETIKQKSGGSVTPIALRGQSAALPFTFGPFLHSQGVSWTKPDGTPNFDDPKAIEAIDRYATLAREYGPPGVVNNTFTQSSALFAAGNAAMELESSNEVSSIIDPKTSKIADKIGVLDFPAGSAGSKTTVLSWGLSVSSFSKNKDAAWKFVSGPPAEDAAGAHQVRHRPAAHLGQPGPRLHRHAQHRDAQAVERGADEGADRR